MLYRRRNGSIFRRIVPIVSCPVTAAVASRFREGTSDVPSSGPCVAYMTLQHFRTLMPPWRGAWVWTPWIASSSPSSILYATISHTPHLHTHVRAPEFVPVYARARANMHMHMSIQITSRLPSSSSSSSPPRNLGLVPDSSQASMESALFPLPCPIVFPPTPSAPPPSPSLSLPPTRSASLTRTLHRMFHRVFHRMLHRMFHRMCHRMFLALCPLQLEDQATHPSEPAALACMRASERVCARAHGRVTSASTLTFGEAAGRGRRSCILDGMSDGMFDAMLGEADGCCCIAVISMPLGPLIPPSMALSVHWTHLSSVACVDTRTCAYMCVWTCVCFA